MTLTVRLPAPLESELDAYCAAHGLTKSQVVQESLAEYLVRTQRKGRTQPQAKPSSNYLAFKKAGLIGCFRGDGVSATKEVVRQRVLAGAGRRG